MILEKDFESILCKYPELIEPGLTLCGRQITKDGLRFDLLYKDKHDVELLVELKRGTITREHVGQAMEYEGALLSPDNPDLRVMLVGTRVPPNLRRSLEHHGFECKEISITGLKEYLSTQNDEEFLSLFEDEILIQDKENKQTRSGKKESKIMGTFSTTKEFHKNFWEAFIAYTKKSDKLRGYFKMPRPLYYCESLSLWPDTCISLTVNYTQNNIVSRLFNKKIEGESYTTAIQHKEALKARLKDYSPTLPEPAAKNGSIIDCERGLN